MARGAGTGYGLFIDMQMKLGLTVSLLNEACTIERQRGGVCKKQVAEKNRHGFSNW